MPDSLTNVPYVDPNLQNTIVKMTAQGRVTGMMFGSYTFNQGSIADGGVGSQTVSFPGLKANDIVMVGTPQGLSGLSPVALYSSAGNAAIRFTNNTGAPIDLGSLTFTLLAFQVTL